MYNFPIYTGVSVSGEIASSRDQSENNPVA